MKFVYFLCILSAASCRTTSRVPKDPLIAAIMKRYSIETPEKAESFLKKAEVLSLKDQNITKIEVITSPLSGELNSLSAPRGRHGEASGQTGQSILVKLGRDQSIHKFKKLKKLYP